ncbi:MAG: diaminopimelate decarboxylase [Candidatus Promineifilaceae bacterium]
MNDAYLWPDSAEIHENTLHIAHHSVIDLAAQFGTPLYLFDEATIIKTARAFQQGLEQYPAHTHIHYASKAFLNTAIAQLMSKLGVGLDVVSVGELAIGRHAGADLALMNMHGNATPRAELAQAVEWGIGRICVDNLNQLDTLINICAEQDKRQTILLRIAPDVVAGGNAKIQTGSKKAKFGLNIADGSALKGIKLAHRSEHINLVGLHAHTGSQIRSFEALQATLERLFSVADMGYEACGWQMREICPGGGLAVPTNNTQSAPLIADYCAITTQTVQREAEKRGWPLPSISIEPGRSMITRSAVAVYRVNGHKQLDDGSCYLHADGGIGDNLRPAMYNAVYGAMNANRPNSPASTAYRLAGRYCESGDILIPHLMLPKTEIGDLIALPAAGAYTLSMASNYNGIGRPAVVLLRDGEAKLIQRRETWEDIIRRDYAL